MDKKWLILFCSFSILTFFFSVITCSMIFFSDQAHTKINSEEVLASDKVYKSTSIIYNQSNEIRLSSLNPGDVKTYTFEITNNNSNAIKYAIKWQNVTSTWNVLSQGSATHPEEFVYSITCTDGSHIENQTMPDTNQDKNILKNLELKTNDTNSCSLSITFIKKNEDQSYNLYKSFGGIYKVIVEE